MRNCSDRLEGVRLFAGDWKDVAKLLERERLHYDVVLGSDTVYCPESLVALLTVTTAALDPANKASAPAEGSASGDVDDRFDGTSTAFFTGRTYYFGVGGGTRDLCRTLEKDFPNLRWHRAEHFTRGVERETVAITLA